MNKKAILFFGLVVLCIVVIIVINKYVNSPDSDEAAVNDQYSARQEAAKVVDDVQEQTQETLKNEEPSPTYEATVGNGTILF